VVVLKALTQSSASACVVAMKSYVRVVAVPTEGVNTKVLLFASQGGST
jgi:hypothetical protein